jgi:RNA polymerase sigma-70 factor (ECF subfamily)
MADELLPEFLAEAAAGAPQGPEAEAALRGLLESARAAWSAFDVPDAAFARHLGAAWSSRKVPLANLRGPDLFLACACARGDAAALAELDRLIREACVSVPGTTPTDAEEVAQRLRHRLMLPEEGEPPDIVLYSGEGPLRAWLRVVAVRETGRGREPRTAQSADELQNLAGNAPDPELDYLRLRHRDDFRAAFASAIAALTPRERNVLRLYYLDGLGVQRIGDLHQVNASTVSRWLASIRESLFARTRAVLEERLRLTESEVDSLLGALRSQLGASLHRLLAPP